MISFRDSCSGNRTNRLFWLSPSDAVSLQVNYAHDFAKCRFVPSVFTIYHTVPGNKTFNYAYLVDVFIYRCINTSEGLRSRVV